MRRHPDLRRLAWGAPFCAIAALLAPWELVSLIFAAPLALVMPGYAIVSAAFARRELDPARFAVLSVALSLATLALGSVVLNYVPGGIRGVSWAVLLLLVVLGSARTAALRRDGKSAAPRGSRIRRLNHVELGMALGALSATIAALVLASTTLPAKDALGFTELWIVPVPESGGSEARIGVRSEEQAATEFDLGVRIDKGRLIRRSFRLAPGESRVFTIGPPVASAGSAVPVVATLLLDSDPRHVYRRVSGSLVAPEAR